MVVYKLFSLWLIKDIETIYKLIHLWDGTINRNQNKNKKMGVEVLIQPTKEKIVKCGRRRSRI